MSYDIRLVDPGTNEVLHLDEAHHFKGGTYCLGGTSECSHNITYNYTEFYHEHIDAEKGTRSTILER